MLRSPLLTFQFHGEEFRIGLSRSCSQVTFSIPQDWQSTKPHLDSALIQPVNIQIGLDFEEQQVRSSFFTLRGALAERVAKIHADDDGDKLETKVAPKVAPPPAKEKSEGKLIRVKTWRTAG